MSNYANFVSDFPGRCAHILRTFDKPARQRDREVTLLLSLAMPSIVIPLERLEGPGTGHREVWRGHPSGDWDRFRGAKAKLEELLEKPFLGSPLWPDAAVGSWFFGELADVSGPPDTWEELQNPKAMGSKKTSRTVVRHIRNAMAHGNIFTRGQPKIETIILLSQVSPQVYKFNYLAVSNADFRGFLESWLAFFADLRLPTGGRSYGTLLVCKFSSIRRNTRGRHLQVAGNIYQTQSALDHCQLHQFQSRNADRSRTAAPA